MNTAVQTTDPNRDLDTLYRRLNKAIRLRDRIAEINLRNEINRLELYLRLLVGV